MRAHVHLRVEVYAEIATFSVDAMVCWSTMTVVIYYPPITDL